MTLQEGFGRITATTARQVDAARFRDADENLGEFSAREDDIVGGVIQRDARANAPAWSWSGWAATKGTEGVHPRRRAGPR